jgi:hypothetical protein
MIAGPGKRAPAFFLASRRTTGHLVKRGTAKRDILSTPPWGIPLANMLIMLTLQSKSLPVLQLLSREANRNLRRGPWRKN